MLEADLKITLANRARHKTFQTSPDKTIGTKLYALGNEQWNIPALRELLEGLVPLSDKRSRLSDHARIPGHRATNDATQRHAHRMAARKR